MRLVAMEGVVMVMGSSQSFMRDHSLSDLLE